MRRWELARPVGWARVTSPALAWRMTTTSSGVASARSAPEAFASGRWLGRSHGRLAETVGRARSAWRRTQTSLGRLMDPFHDDRDVVGRGVVDQVGDQMITERLHRLLPMRDGRRAEPIEADVDHFPPPFDQPVGVEDQDIIGRQGDLGLPPVGSPTASGGPSASSSQIAWLSRTRSGGGWPALA